MILALATPPVAGSVEAALGHVRRCVAEAAERRADIVCFPEAYLPGLRGLDFDVAAFDRAEQERAWRAVAEWARTYRIATILGSERTTEAGRQIVAAVFAADGTLLGVQTKNQLDPSEEPLYVPGTTRQIFEVKGVKFGIAICHEGFRYPETVRWAAARGAQIVFHPHCTGSDKTGVRPSRWGDPSGPYYEKAMMCRALENTVWFASVNYGFRYPESATSVISPTGECVAHLPYGECGVLVREIDVAAATGLLARRYAPQRHRETATD
jgi:predicted amidohydrolase